MSASDFERQLRESGFVYADEVRVYRDRYGRWVSQGPPLWLFRFETKAEARKNAICRARLHARTLAREARAVEEGR